MIYVRICNHLPDTVANEYKPKIYNNLVLSAVCISIFNMTILNVPAMHVLSPPGNNAAVAAPNLPSTKSPLTIS